MPPAQIRGFLPSQLPSAHPPCTPVLPWLAYHQEDTLQGKRLAARLLWLPRGLPESSNPEDGSHGHSFLQTRESLSALAF